MTLLAHVQTAGAATSGNIDTTGATLLIAVVAFDRGELIAAQSIVDSKGNTWTHLTPQLEASFPANVIWYSIPTSVGSGHNFSCAIAAGAGQHASSFAAYDATAAASVFDVENGSSGSGVSSCQPGSVTPAAASSLIIAGWAAGGADKSASLAIDSSFATVDIMPAAGTYNGGHAYLYTGSAKNPTWSWTETGSGRFATTIAVFKPGAGGGSPVLMGQACL